MRANEERAEQIKIIRGKQPHAETQIDNHSRIMLLTSETKLLISKWVRVLQCFVFGRNREMNRQTFIINDFTRLGCDKQQYELYDTPTMPRGNLNQFSTLKRRECNESHIQCGFTCICHQIAV